MYINLINEETTLNETYLLGPICTWNEYKIRYANQLTFEHSSYHNEKINYVC